MGGEVNKLCGLGFDPGLDGGDMTGIVLIGRNGRGVVFSCAYSEPAGRRVALGRLEAAARLEARGLSVSWRKRGGA
jgi:glycine cleavage system aminomethyltransferase T